ncbi:hypothetical protein H0H81_002415 [Sphagnurus paluster]|uniref:Alpha/beta-hydrolase n=1 Tax=Sphagnurus paluster TaxID=117069 RepID=A0A9P7FVK6_9AGAR|nr:hypothetical protein H0H81_002415 [Sphagnurus paluster]
MSSQPSYKHTLVIAGLEVHVYSAAPIIQRKQSTKELVVFFLLHKRYDSVAHVDPIARSLIELTNGNARDLLIVAFDQRNHGKRLFNPKRNEPNERLHAVELYATQTGTSRDITFLIDLLPTFLYPDDELHPIVEWGVAGISLGGHATWISLANALYDITSTIRGGQANVPLKRPRFPENFRVALQVLDPPYLVRGGENPFLGKRILVLSSRDDKLVPWEASRQFVEEQLDVGRDGVKKVSLHEGVGHECTGAMIQEMAKFIVKHCLHKTPTARL